MKKLLPFLLLFFTAMSVTAGTLYRWVDADGKVHYTDEPPPPTAKSVQQKDLGAGPSNAVELPYAVKMAASKHPVTLFANDCGEWCDKARQHLAKRGVPHSVKDPSSPAGGEELKKLTGKLEVPVLVVGSSVTKGYETGSWDAALDAAGYPKSAYLPKPAVKKPAAKPAEGEPQPAAQPATQPAGK